MRETLFEVKWVLDLRVVRNTVQAIPRHFFFALRCEIEWGGKKANFTRSSSLEQFFEIDVKCAYFELLKFSVKLHIKNNINFVFPEVH